METQMRPVYIVGDREFNDEKEALAYETKKQMTDEVWAYVRETLEDKAAVQQKRVANIILAWEAHKAQAAAEAEASS